MPLTRKYGNGLLLLTGELEVAPAQVTYIDSTADIPVTATTATDANAVWNSTTYANEFTGKVRSDVRSRCDAGREQVCRLKSD